MKVSFTVPGPPQGKGRPRFRQVGGYTQTYTPRQTAVYENLVKLSYKDELGNITLNGAISAEIRAYFPIPVSVSKKKRRMMEEGYIPCLTKPDTDNIAKIILDSLNEIAFKDDKQVSDLMVIKKYGEQPRVEVILEEIGNED